MIQKAGLCGSSIYPMEALETEELTSLGALLAEFGKIPIGDLDMDSFTVNTESIDATDGRRTQLELKLRESKVLIGVETSKGRYTSLTYTYVNGSGKQVTGSFLKLYKLEVYDERSPNNWSNIPHKLWLGERQLKDHLKDFPSWFI